MTTFEEIQKAKILGTYNLFAKPDADIIIKAKELSESPKFKKVMGEWKEGTLTSSSGEKVTNQKQALAIAFSEAQKVEKAEESLGGEMVKGGQGSGRKSSSFKVGDKIKFHPHSSLKVSKDGKGAGYAKHEGKITHAYPDGHYDVEDSKGFISRHHPDKSNFEKSNEDELEKGGQGSGRKKTQMTKYDSIGKTKSGKNVYGFFNHPDHEDFSEQDHLDAAKLHQNEKNPKIDVNHYDYHHQTGEFHKEAAQKVNKSEENNNGLVNKGEIDGVLTLLNKSLFEEIDIKKAEEALGGEMIKGGQGSGRHKEDQSNIEVENLKTQLSQQKTNLILLNKNTKSSKQRFEANQRILNNIDFIKNKLKSLGIDISNL